MSTDDELVLLIKSRFPVVFFESVDENYAVRQLKSVAEQMGLVLYEWSLTEGLRPIGAGAPYLSKEVTTEPAKMLRNLIYVLTLQEEQQLGQGLFVLKDFEKHLDDPLVSRLFKDAINHIRNTRNTIVIVSTEYKLPRDIESDSAHIVGGYPSEKEIMAVVADTVADMRRTDRQAALSLTDEENEKIVKALKGLSVQQIRNVTNQCVLDDHTFDIRDLPRIEAYKKKVFDRAGLLEFQASEDKNSIAGFTNLKRWLWERKDAFAADKDSSLPRPRGLLLTGVQGCGKSLAVRVIARQLGLPLYRLDLGSLYSKYVGETEANLRKALTTAEKLSPVCLWIDEIEKGFAASGSDVDGGVSLRILGTFLTWMQERKSDCFIAATANIISLLPPEFMRKGRFDEVFFVDLPDTAERKQLFTIHLEKRRLRPQEFDIVKLAGEADGFSGAEIEQAIISALYRASSEKRTISTGDVMEQLASTRPLSALRREEIEALRDWARERTVAV